MLYRHIQIGKPRTFGKYTGRAAGMVDGIRCALSVAKRMGVMK